MAAGVGRHHDAIGKIAGGQLDLRLRAMRAEPSDENAEHGNARKAPHGAQKPIARSKVQARFEPDRCSAEWHPRYGVGDERPEMGRADESQNEVTKVLKALVSGRDYKSDAPATVKAGWPPRRSLKSWSS